MALYDEEDIERAELYRLFSSLFMREPDDDVIMRMKETFNMKFSDTPNEIRSDFAHILTHDIHLSPHESLYVYPLGDTPRLWGRAAEKVRAFYESAGLMIDEETELAPDHLGVELLFMSYLIENGLLEKQKRFIEEHLSQWVAEYCREVERHASTMFYKEVAILLREFISSEYEELAGGA